MIGTFLTFAMALQSADEGVIAIQPEKPQTWTLEYPAMIRPQVQEYYNCLKSRTKYIGGERDFESQHREDIPRCAERGGELLAQAKAIIAGSKRPDQATPEEIEVIFETVRQIHIARGKDIDDQVEMRLAANQRYQEAQAREEAEKSEATGVAQ